MDGFGFVFEKWLDTQYFTNHSSSDFVYSLTNSKDINVSQGNFCHTEKVDHTGAVVWDDAVVLARYLEKKVGENAHIFKGKNVVELGCGCGLIGILMSKLGANVVLTDRADMMPLIRENIKRNSVENKCSYVVHEWGSNLDSLPDPLNKPFDIIIASGCVYHQEAVPLLNKSIQRLASEDATVYFAIDFRFDIRNRRESDFIAPVVKSFLEGTPLIMNKIPYEMLDQNFIKDSVMIYECSLPK
mmetsp:Transcript_15044/g.18608  ORF Transcript_15044/g.18608 Transcript_15044/m.18608 type:complete len:243 (+) Transcript_15044:78-806(+)